MNGTLRNLVLGFSLTAYNSGNSDKNHLYYISKISYINCQKLSYTDEGDVRRANFLIGEILECTLLAVLDLATPLCLSD